GGRCSITGGYVYRGTQGALPDGTYIYGDYCTGEILAWDGAAQSVLLTPPGVNISSFGEDEQGEMYVVNHIGTIRQGASMAGPRVVEYYHPEFDHYFMTAMPDEIAKLDNGITAGWTRTDRAFNVSVSGAPSTASVCRFFSTAFGTRSSHFYTTNPAECAIVR